MYGFDVQPFGAQQAAMAGMQQTQAHQQFAQQYQPSPYQGAPPRPYGQQDMMQANAQMLQRPAWASPGGWNQMQQAQQQPRQAPVAYARPMAQNTYGNQLAQQQPRQMQQRPAPQRIPQMQSAPGLQNQAYQQQAQRVQQNANAIQQAQARPLGAGAGAAAAAQGIRSPSAPIGQIGAASTQQLGQQAPRQNAQMQANSAANAVRSPTAPINQIQRNTMARI